MLLNAMLALQVSGLIFAIPHLLSNPQFHLSNEVLRELANSSRIPTSLNRFFDGLKLNGDVNKSDTDVMKYLKASPLPSPLDSFPVVEENKPHPFSRSWYTGEELAAEFSTLPVCQRECVKSLYNAMAKMMKTSSYAEKYRNICRAFKETMLCAAEERRRCGESDEMFNVMSSGIHYVCVVQQNAFNAFISCIDREAHEVQTLCEHECSYHGHIFNILSRLSLSNDFGDLLGQLRSSAPKPVPVFGEAPIPPTSIREGVPGLVSDRRVPQIDTTSLRALEDIVDQACVYGECALGCIRNKFNLKCEENVGSLISEALVRPLVEGHQKFSLLFVALGIIAPKSCSFLYKGASLSQHRIDPKVHEELLLKYSKAHEGAGTESADRTKDSKSTIDVSDLRLVDAYSDLEHLINLIYENATFDDVDDLNDTFVTEEDMVDFSSDPLLKSTNITVESLFNNLLAEGSGELGEIIFRKSLKAGTSTFEFTPNISGTIHCRVFPTGWE